MDYYYPQKNPSIDIIIIITWNFNVLFHVVMFLFYICIYNHRTTKTNQKYPSVNL